MNALVYLSQSTRFNHNACASTFTRMQDVVGADELFKRALAVDCMDSSVTSAYVEFLEKHLEGDYR